MKKLIALFAALLLVLGLFAGCQSGSTTQQADPDAAGTDGAMKVVLLIPGTLGDKSFFDAANKGMQMAKSELGVEIKVIEMGTDKTKYEPTFRDVCAQNWDLIISGSPDMTDIFNQYCADYPEKAFMNYDAANDLVTDNLYTVAYAANELSYLSGVIAAICTQSDIPNMNAEAKIGFLGGMDIPGINDFLVGYIQGAKDVNPDIKIAISYAQDFANPGKGKELAINQYNSGVDIIFGVAGGTGLGALDAASEKELYAIGVDSDQALLFQGTDEKKAGQIITSAIKQIDQVVFNAIQLHQQGTLPLGQYQVLSFQDGGVGIACNEYYERIVPDDLKAQIDEIEQKLINGEVTVPTAIGMPQETLNQMRDSVA